VRGLRWALLWLILLAALLAPFLLWEDRLSELAGRLAAASRPAWLASTLLAGLLALDVLLPVPSSVVSTALGALLGFWKGAAVCWCGMTAGCLLGYALGSRAARRAARSLVGERELERVSRASERFGPWMILLFRAVPVLAEASVIFAGIAGMAPARFLLVALSSNLGISLAYAGVGAFSARVESFLLAFAGSLLAPLLALILARQLSR